MSHHVSCLTTVSLSGLFCFEALAFLAENRSLGLFTRCLLAYCKTVVFEVIAIVYLDNCTSAMSQSQTFYQCPSFVSI